MKTLSMKTRMSLTVSLLFVLAIALLAWGALSYQEESLQEAISRQQLALTSSLAASIDDKLSLAHNALITAARQMPPETLRNADSAQRFLDARLSLHSIFDNLILISRNGKLIAESPFLPGRRGMDLTSQGYFQSTVATGKPYISEPRTCSHNHHHPAIFLTSPVFDTKGRLVAIAVGSFDLWGSNFLEELSRTRYGDASYFYLTDRDRTIIVHPDRSKILTKELPEGTNPLYEKALAGFDGSGETVNAQGARVITSIRHLRTTGWILAANYSAAEAYAPLETARRYFLLGALACTLIVLSISWYLMKRLTAPLADFTRHVELLPETFGQHHFLGIESDDEIGILAQTFNRMVTTLEAQQAANESRLVALLRLNEMNSSSLHELADFALEEAVQLTRSKIGYLAFVNDDESLLTMYSWSREAMRECAIADKPLEYPLAGTGLWGEAVRQRKPVITNDYAAPNPCKKGCPEGHVEVRRHMNTPIFDGERIVIVAGVGNKDEAYDETDVHQLTLLMQGMWRLIQRKRIEEELRRSEERYRHLYTETPVMLHSIDQDGRLVNVSNYWLDTLGYKRNEVLGRKTSEFLTEESRRYAEEVVLPEFFRTGSCTEVPYRVVKRDGEILDVLLSATAERDDEGKVIRSLAVMIDVTERKRAGEEIKKLNSDLAARAVELENANRELEAFSYSVSHDLRKPLTLINGYAQIIQDLGGKSLNNDCQNYLQEISDGVLRMTELIDALLKFSRASCRELHRETVNFSDIAYDVASDLALAEPERLVRFKIASGITVRGDEKLLRIVLENLFGNAWKYSAAREDAAIEFGVANVDGETACFVRDNGIGFDMTHAARIFTPFHRLPGADKFRGHGIGLGTVERIIQRHGGRIWAEGVPGEGATFWFTL
ncbi:MAG: PAS domain S-box protein [Desulfuromonas sp.]|nr:PAS domain S-box protein [Desulfuromonas sp.]